VRQEMIEALRERLARDFAGIGEREMVLLYPGGGLLPIRAWPAENFCTVAEDLINNGYGVGIIGLKEDHALARWMADRLKSDACFDLTGYTRTVEELIRLFHLTSLLITNDGGPGHFASLTPIAAIVLFGPETPVLYGPLGKKVVSLHASLSCSPCLTAYNHRNSPCDGNNRCLKTIRPKTVLEEAYRLLKA
jgi:ADP-heptose:LPS heptosyltransferase